jgi:DNA-binding response OmpR family regulator
MDKRNILLVEDNEALNEGNRRALEAEGYGVLSALTLREAREHLYRYDPDVILLDVLLPDGSGFDFCEEIRHFTTAHIIFLTSRKEHEDQLRAMLLGGDDYISKPFKLDIMLARVSSAMRRREMSKTPPKTLALGDLVLDLLSDRALLKNEDLLLTPKEFSLLYFFAQHINETIGAALLYRHVWGQPMGDNVSAIRKTVSRLRSKIEGSGYTVTSNRGDGYRFGQET